MSDPVLRTPLGLPALAFARGRKSPAVTLEEAPFATRLGLRAAETVATRIGVALGLDLPGAMLDTATGEGIESLRLGPDEWLILATGGEAAALCSEIEAIAGEDHVAAVDLSHRFAEIRIAGPAAVEVLAAGCPLDLDPAVAPSGFASRSLLGKCEIVLQRLAGDRFRLLVDRSFADHCWRFLEHAAAEQGTATPVALP